MLSKGRESWMIVALTLIFFTHFVDMILMAPMSDIIMSALNINTRKYSALQGSYSFAAFLAGILGSFIIDKYDRKWVLIVLYAGFVIGNFGCAYANTFSLLLISRTVAGLFGGILGAVIFAIVGDTIPAERRGAATGKVMSAFGISSVIGIPFGLELGLKFGYNFPFGVLSWVSLVILIISFWAIPSVKTHMNVQMQKMSTWELMKDILKNKNQLYSILSLGLMMMAGFVFIPFIAPYLVRNNGFQPHHLKWIYVCGGLASFASSMIVGKLSDKFGASRVFVTAVFISIFPMLLLTNLPSVGLFFTLVTTTLFFIGNGSRISPAITQLNNHVEPKYRGNFMSINSFVQSLFTGLSVVVGGLIIQINPISMKLENFNIAGYVAVFFSIVIIYMARKIGK